MLLFQRCIVRPIVLIAILLSCFIVHADTINVHMTQNQVLIHADPVSGELMINLITPTDSDPNTSERLEFVEGYIQENAHDAPRVSLPSMTGNAVCAQCSGQNQMVISNATIMNLNHNASYTLHLNGVVKGFRMSPPGSLPDRPVTPDDVTFSVNRLHVTQAPRNIISWDPATMSNVTLSSNTDDARVGTQQFKYTISGPGGTVDKLFPNEVRPYNHSFQWDGKNSLNSIMPKGLYSTKIKVSANQPPVSEDCNRSDKLTVSAPSVVFVARDDINYIYDISFSLADSLNASEGQIQLYDPDLGDPILTFPLSEDQLTASTNGTNHTKRITIPVSSVTKDGLYWFVVCATDSHADEYRTHMNLKAMEGISTKDIRADWDIVLDKCSGSWLPLLGNTTSMTATIYPSTKTGYINFAITDPTSYLGYCSNAGTYLATDKDMLFTYPQANMNIGNDHLWGFTTSSVNTASIQITSYDCGAWSKLDAYVTIGSETKHAHVRETDTTKPIVKYATIPLDEDANKIADGWIYNNNSSGTTGGVADDTESSPTGINTGDGFSRLDEYRGFVTLNAYARTNPNDVKDIFIYDQNNLGIGYFPNLGLTSHLISNTEWDSATRKVNFKGDNNQCGILMRDASYDPIYLGYTFPGVGTPNQVTEACIYTQRIREWGGNNSSRLTWENPYDYNVLYQTTAHELGHAVNISHHSNGTLCIMRNPCPDNHNPPTQYCQSNPGCATKSKLH